MQRGVQLLMEFGDILLRLTPAAEDLFTQMVEAHLASKPGNRIFLVLQSGIGTFLVFTGEAGLEQDAIDQSALNDLVGYGLIRQFGSDSGGNAKLDVSGESLLFYKYLQSERGQVIDQAADTAMRLVNGERFAQEHPSSSHHLREAQALLAADRTDDATVSEIGSHLRSALFDVVGDVDGIADKDPEQVAKRLAAWMDGRAEKRAAQLLVALTDSARYLSQRLDHIRDETSKDRPLGGHDELRRAVLLVTVCCYEIDQATRQRAVTASP